MNILTVETKQSRSNSLPTLNQYPTSRFNNAIPAQLEQVLACMEDTQLKAQLLTFLYPRIDIRLDFENLYIGLKRTGRALPPQTLIKAVKSAVADLGEISRIVAYADWSLLNKKNGQDIQRQLELLGLVETRYQINIRNKNSADMRIASDIHEQLEKDAYLPGTVDIFVLGSGDRDFRPVVNKAKNRGKKVVILALKNSLSGLLIEAASEVRYLDNYLGQPKPHQRGHR